MASMPALCQLDCRQSYDKNLKFAKQIFRKNDEHHRMDEAIT
jgi:hypothetical protein